LRASAKNVAALRSSSPIALSWPAENKLAPITCAASRASPARRAVVTRRPKCSVATSSSW
jgi:hypothetical protein